MIAFLYLSGYLSVCAIMLKDNDNAAWADLPCVANQRLNKVCLDAASSNLQKQRQPCGPGRGLSQCLGLQCY